MTDMTNAKKRVIRSRARRFAMDLHDASFDSGLAIYQMLLQEKEDGGLYDGSARIRLCLKCGVIEAATNLKKSNHSCALDFKSFQVLVTTSWVNLSEFFLTDRYVKSLRDIGVELEERDIVTVPVEAKIEVPATIKNKETADASISDK